MYLNEDLFEIVDSEDIVLDNKEQGELSNQTPGPEVGVDTGLTDMLLSLINDENEAIQGYNTFIANLQDHPEFIPVINDINAEENNHIGMLQVLLQKLSPNAVCIEDGKEEAHEILAGEV